MNNPSRGSWLQTDTTESAYAKTDYRTSGVDVLIETVEPVLESSIKEAHLQKFHIAALLPFPLNGKKAHRNPTRQAIDLLAVLASLLHNLFTDDVPVVVKLRNFG